MVFYPVIYVNFIHPNGGVFFRQISDPSYSGVPLDAFASMLNDNVGPTLGCGRNRHYELYITQHLFVKFTLNIILHKSYLIRI